MDEILRGLGSVALEESLLVNRDVVTIVLEESPTVSDLRSQLRRSSLRRSNGRACYYYVVNLSGKLLGVVSLDKLAIAEPEDKTESVFGSAEVYCLEGKTTASAALNMLRLSVLRALPVVSDGRFIGVIDWETFYEVARGKPLSMPEQDVEIANLKHDISMIIGFDAVAMHGSSIFGAYRLRAPWLGVTLAAGILCAVTIARYEHLLAVWPILAGFIPLVLAFADAVCHQASTIAVVDELGTKRNRKMILSALWKEVRVALMIGGSACLLVLTFVALWQQSIWPALAIGLAIVLSVTVGGVIGFIVPVVLRLCRRDPHFAGGPMALAVTDVLATLTLLEAGRVFLG